MCAALRFEHVAEIAVGALARVDLCRAFGGGLEGRLVAVKRLHEGHAADPDVTSRFLDEVWMTSALRHPNVVDVVGWGTDDRGAYLATELVQGVSLARLRKTVLETGEQFSERFVVQVGARIAAGLDAAHTLRAPSGEPLDIVHRDLTAENVLLGFHGGVKITDFGLAKARQRLAPGTIAIDLRRSSPVAPEEVAGAAADHRADLFALGLLLFELLAKRPPWIGATEVEALTRVVTEPPADLRELRPRVDRNLAALIEACLEKSPSDRPGRAAVVRERLEGWLDAHGHGRDEDAPLARFVRRNAMRQMRWFEQVLRGTPGAAAEPAPPPRPGPEPAPRESRTPPPRDRNEETVVARASRPPSAEPALPVIAEGRAPHDEDWEPTLVKRPAGGAAPPRPQVRNPPRPARASPPPPRPGVPSLIEDAPTVTRVDDEPAALRAALEEAPASQAAPLSLRAVRSLIEGGDAPGGEQLAVDAATLRLVAGRRNEEARAAKREADEAARRAMRALEAARAADEIAALVTEAARLTANGEAAAAKAKLERARAVAARGRAAARR
jgi:serine/threonine-protein kinase